MKSLKQFSGKKIKENTGQYPIWQEGFYDQLIGRKESLEDIIIYCWNNPVRAKLIHQPDEYSYWWSQFKIE